MPPRRTKNGKRWPKRSPKKPKSILPDPKAPIVKLSTKVLTSIAREEELAALAVKSPTYFPFLVPAVPAFRIRDQSLMREERPVRGRAAYANLAGFGITEFGEREQSEAPCFGPSTSTQRAEREKTMEFDLDEEDDHEFESTVNFDYEIVDTPQVVQEVEIYETIPDPEEEKEKDEEEEVIVHRRERSPSVGLEEEEEDVVVKETIRSKEGENGIMKNDEKKVRVKPNSIVDYEIGSSSDEDEEEDKEDDEEEPIESSSERRSRRRSTPRPGAVEMEEERSTPGGSEEKKEEEDKVEEKEKEKEEEKDEEEEKEEKKEEEEQEEEVIEIDSSEVSTSKRNIDHREGSSSMWDRPSSSSSTTPASSSKASVEKKKEEPTKPKRDLPAEYYKDYLFEPLPSSFEYCNFYNNNCKTFERELPRGDSPFEPGNGSFDQFEKNCEDTIEFLQKQATFDREQWEKQVAQAKIIEEEEKKKREEQTKSKSKSTGRKRRSVRQSTEQSETPPPKKRPRRSARLR